MVNYRVANPGSFANHLPSCWALMFQQTIRARATGLTKGYGEGRPTCAFSRITMKEPDNITRSCRAGSVKQPKHLPQAAHVCACGRFWLSFRTIAQAMLRIVKRFRCALSCGRPGHHRSHIRSEGGM